jgi:hypothetical protein
MLAMMLSQKKKKKKKKGEILSSAETVTRGAVDLYQGLSGGESDCEMGFRRCLRNSGRFAP